VIVKLDYKQLVEVFSAALTPLIAIVAIYIAYQQFQTNRSKLRHDLYEKRIKVYRKIYEHLGSIVAFGDVQDEKIIDFYSETSDSQFLFDSEISDYVRSIYQKSTELHTVMKYVKGQYKCSEEKRLEAIDKDAQLMRWFSAQFEVTKKKFTRYLRIE